MFWSVIPAQEWDFGSGRTLRLCWRLRDKLQLRLCWNDASGEVTACEDAVELVSDESELPLDESIDALRACPVRLG